MEALGNLVLAATALIEAEGRTLKRTLARFVVALGLILAAALLGLVGFGFVLGGLFSVLAIWLGKAGAAVIFGVIALALAGFCSWIARDLTIR